MRLRDDQVRPFFGRPPDLLAVHLAHELTARLGRVRVVDPRVADVAGDERVAFAGDLLREAKRVPVQRLQILLAPDHAQLLAVPVVRERNHHLCSRAQELAVKLAHRVGEVENGLGHVRAALQVAAALELEEVALGAEHDVVLQPPEQASHREIV